MSCTEGTQLQEKEGKKRRERLETRTARDSPVWGGCGRSFHSRPGSFSLLYEFPKLKLFQREGIANDSLLILLFVFFFFSFSLEDTTRSSKFFHLRKSALSLHGYQHSCRCRFIPPIYALRVSVLFVCLSLCLSVHRSACLFVCPS